VEKKEFEKVIYYDLNASCTHSAENFSKRISFSLLAGASVKARRNTTIPRGREEDSNPDENYNLNFTQ
jgi:hypothetical protein